MACRRTLRAVVLVALCSTLQVPAPAAAIETDQFFAWGRHLADSTDVLNARIHLELESLVAALNRKRRPDQIGCREVRSRFNGSFSMLIFNGFELWAVNSPLVSRVPMGHEEIREYRRGYLYGTTSVLDTGTWMPPSPTVLVHDVLIGTDKLTHFLGTSWYYHRWYRKARAQGRSHDEAMHHAVRKGMEVENTILGKAVSGVFSPGDLEANYQGLLFYNELCEGENPTLELSDGHWRVRRPFDLRDYVTPEWDESWQPVSYTPKRWRTVRPVMLQYCSLLDDPQIRARRQSYRERDRTTLTEQFIEELIEQGKVTDPADFAIEHVCAQASPDTPKIGP